MSIEYRADGSVMLASEPDQSVTMLLPPDMDKESQDAAIVKFFTDNPCPVIDPVDDVRARIASVLGVSLDDLKAALA